jgi:hypothetical protein
MFESLNFGKGRRLREKDAKERRPVRMQWSAR